VKIAVLLTIFRDFCQYSSRLSLVYSG